MDLKEDKQKLATADMLIGINPDVTFRAGTMVIEDNTEEYASNLEEDTEASNMLKEAQVTGSNYFIFNSKKIFIVTTV